jgi:hypothetical protein
MGLVDEDADFRPLLREIGTCNHLHLDLGGVERINSCGIREWINFRRNLPGEASIELSRCTPAVVALLNMIHNFASNAQIISVYAPFVCNECGEDEDVLFDVQDGCRPNIEGRACRHCGTEMIFDDIEESYFSFLAHEELTAGTQ